MLEIDVEVPRKKVLVEVFAEETPITEVYLPGVAGRSAYQLAVDAGFEGTLEEWLASLKGEPGEKGDPIDVQINGASIVDETGIAEIPYTSSSGYGLVRVGTAANGEMSVGNTNGRSILRYPVISTNGLKNRKSQGTQYGGVVDGSNFDLAVKTAMTDGVGTAWTDAEQKAARARMGAVSAADVLELFANGDKEAY